MSTTADRIIERYANLALMPKKYPSLSSNLVRGDLHGNSLNLLYFLIEHDFVNCSKENYEKFYWLYRHEADNHYTEKDKNNVDALIDNLTRGDAHQFIRLLGDELCDRGANDYMTLRLLQKMEALDIPYEIYQSNHTLDFSLAYEALTSKQKPLLIAYRKAKSAYDTAKRGTNPESEEFREITSNFENAQNAYNKAMKEGSFQLTGLLPLSLMIWLKYICVTKNS